MRALGRRVTEIEQDLELNKHALGEPSGRTVWSHPVLQPGRVAVATWAAAAAAAPPLTTLVPCGRAALDPLAFGSLADLPAQAALSGALLQDHVPEGKVPASSSSLRAPLKTINWRYDCMLISIAVVKACLSSHD